MPDKEGTINNNPDVGNIPSSGSGRNPDLEKASLPDFQFTPPPPPPEPPTQTPPSTNDDN